MTPDRDKRERDDIRHLAPQPEFQRFLWRVIQSARIFARTTDGSNDRNLAFDEGRRSLGLEVLEMVEAGQPVSHPEGQPVLTVFQVLREEATQPQEKPSDRKRFNRTDELDDAETD